VSGAGTFNSYLIATLSAPLRNRATGQVLHLPVYVYEKQIVIASHAVLQRTYKTGIPDWIFYGGPAPLGYKDQNFCDPSCSWTMSLTINFVTGSDHGFACYSLIGDGYDAIWTRLDRSVAASKAVIHAGISSYVYCGGATHGAANKTVGSPVPGQTYTFMPSWGSWNASTSTSQHFYQCGNQQTTFTRYGSSWDYTTPNLDLGNCS
jgi:hypothetical protein